MRKVLLLLLFLITPIAAQEVADQENLKTTEARYPFGKYEIVIRQQKRLKLPSKEQPETRIKPLFCSASIEIAQNGNIIDVIDFKDIQPYGSRYGIFLPFKQESHNHLILLKGGDYDSRVLLFTSDGKLFNLNGGAYRIFLGRYLISRGWFADSPPAYTIFDLRENKVLLTMDWDGPKRIKRSPPVNGKAQVLKLYTSESELFAGFDIVEENTLRTIGHTEYFYRIDLVTGKVDNAVFKDNVHREFVVDNSNIDMRHDCECIKRAEK